MSEWFWNGFAATLGYIAAGGFLTITLLVVMAVVYGAELIIDWIKRKQAQGELAKYEGDEGRCSVGHNKRFTYDEPEPIGKGCVACERDAAIDRAEQAEARVRELEGRK